MSLKGKIAIVTGGNSGIGMAIVLELAKQGANIVIDYVAHPEATEALEKQVAALGDQAIGVDADVSKVADLQKLINAAVEKFGRLDVMVTMPASRRAHRFSTPPSSNMRKCSQSI
jgi:glucose 1-dehydrogenase